MNAVLPTLNKCQFSSHPCNRVLTIYFGVQLQVVVRGMFGRRRAAARRSMIAAATKALDWVSLENLLPRHLRELARAIHGALVDPVVRTWQSWMFVTRPLHGTNPNC